MSSLFGTWVNLVRNPAILTLLKSGGLNFARVDMEQPQSDGSDRMSP